MFEKEIEELFKLSMRVANETPAFVEFDVLSHVHICHAWTFDQNSIQERLMMI